MSSVSGTIESVKHAKDGYQVSFTRDDGKYGLCNLTLADDKVEIGALKSALTGAFKKALTGRKDKLEFELAGDEDRPQVVAAKINGVAVMKP